MCIQFRLMCVVSWREGLFFNLMSGWVGGLLALTVVCGYLHTKLELQLTFAIGKLQRKIIVKRSS